MQIKDDSRPCFSCDEVNFIDFPNLGLQQPLYGFQVYCSHREDGCEWMGDLGQLDIILT